MTGAAASLSHAVVQQHAEQCCDEMLQLESHLLHELHVLVGLVACHLGQLILQFLTTARWTSCQVKVACGRQQ